MRPSWGSHQRALGYSQWVVDYSVVPLAQTLLVDFLLAVEVVLVLVEERVPGLGREVQLGGLGVDPGVGLGLGAGLWVTGLGRLAVPTL